MIILLISLLISPLFMYKNIIIYPILTSLILLYKQNDKNINIVLAMIFGLLHDILYSKIYINIFLFPIIYILIDYHFNIKKYNLKNIIIILMFIIFIYNSFLFIILNIFNINVYSYTYFITNLVFIYSINIIYTSLLHLFIKIKK